MRLNLQLAFTATRQSDKVLLQRVPLRWCRLQLCRWHFPSTACKRSALLISTHPTASAVGPIRSLMDDSSGPRPTIDDADWAAIGQQMREQDEARETLIKRTRGKPPGLEIRAPRDSTTAHHRRPAPQPEAAAHLSQILLPCQSASARTSRCVVRAPQPCTNRTHQMPASLSTDAQKLAKQAIFSLHRGDNAQAGKQLEQAGEFLPSVLCHMGARLTQSKPPQFFRCSKDMSIHTVLDASKCLPTPPANQSSEQCAFHLNPIYPLFNPWQRP